MSKDNSALSVDKIVQNQQREIPEQKREIQLLKSQISSMQEKLEKYSCRKFACISHFMVLLLDEDV